MDLIKIRHPQYRADLPNMQKYRATMVSGHAFVDTYLKMLSSRENSTDFLKRKTLTYCPAHAKAAVIDIKNAIYQRMADVARVGGPITYQNAIVEDVDNQGSNMTAFIGRKVLPELLFMRKVGVYIDKPNKEIQTLADSREVHPYMYTYTIEQIKSWSYGRDNQLKALLLEDSIYTEQSGLANGEKTSYRYIFKVDDGIVVEIYDSSSNLISSTLLNIKEIPFVIFEIEHSLLIDAADYQIALMNLSSSDLNYAIKSNFPFYTEQYDAAMEQSRLRNGGNKEGSVKIGVTQGRRYPKNTERPGFIHPSPEPLEVSMSKQEQMKKEIRELVNLATSDVSRSSESAESKKVDERGLEAGLSSIGLELEQGENRIAKLWAMYEGKESATVKYPNTYDLKTDSERLDDATKLKKLIPTIPSITFQKEVAKLVASLTIGNKTSNNKVKTMIEEIDKAKVIAIDPEVIRLDKEAGLVDDKTASTARLYPEGSSEQAKIDHADRLARIAASQSNPDDMSGRGVADLEIDKDKSKEEKEGKKKRGKQVGGTE